MQDLIAAGVTWFEQQRREHLAVTVEYLPLGAASAVSVRATIGGSRFESVDSAGQVMRFETRDFLISVEDYATAPVRGDQITETQGGVERAYEVMIPGGGQNPWIWADRSQRVRRIHTTLVEET
jgi:hypothetical protein